MAGQSGPDGRVAESKIDTMDQGGFDQTSWLPLSLRSWTYSGGNYVIAVHGDRFMIAEGAKSRALRN